MKKGHWWILLALICFYFLITSYHLLSLPVFADESIYIRWAQLIIDDPKRYLFFPMNDGKTPLQMWLMLPLQFIFHNQLLAGRILSVFIGLGNVLVIGQISKVLAQKAKLTQAHLAQYLAIFLTTILPFTFFHHRLAITDALLFLNLSLSYLFSLKYVFTKKKIYLLILAIAIFLALFSKLSALLFLPTLLTLILSDKKFSWKKILQNSFFLGLALIFGLGLFYLLRLVPNFPQLFSRGGDFLYPFNSLLSSQIWSTLAKNLIFFAQQFLAYLGIPLLFLALPLCFVDKKQTFRYKIILLLAFLAFILPLAMLGKIIYPRYLLPSSIFIIVAASLTFSEYLNKNLSQKLFAMALIFGILLQSFSFIWPSYFNINRIPFSRLDREQYLEEWSSGQGIWEVSQLLLEKSQNRRIALATEGFFGTLPDGVLLYLHRQKINNLFVEGIGQPINSIPQNFIDKTLAFDEVWLVANSHRLNLDLSEARLIDEYCRPNNAPCLQLWDITELVKK